MKRGFRYQTGEIKDIIKEIIEGNIPKVDIDNKDDLDLVVGGLRKFNVFINDKAAFDEEAVNKEIEPEFAYRVQFLLENKTAYVDFYTPQEPEEDYASVFGD